MFQNLIVVEINVCNHCMYLKEYPNQLQIIHLGKCIIQTEGKQQLTCYFVFSIGVPSFCDMIKWRALTLASSLLKGLYVREGMQLP
jgi:hypothetical protein